MQGVENIQTVSDALSRMLHLNLDARKFISIAEEEKYLQDYLDIQQYRYVGKLTYSISIEDSVKGCVLPKLLIQPIVENALQHGISKEQSVGMVQIRVYGEEEELHILVRNSGPEFPPELLCQQHYCGGASKHIGLQNISRRLNLLYGEKAEMRIVSGENLLTSVEIILPRSSQDEEENTMRIMIVDDDFLVRTNLKRLLETSEKCRNAGYMIIAEAADGDQALHQIEMTEPDVIISDIKMPQMDGLELQKEVKREHPEISMIMLSGYDDLDYVRQALKTEQLIIS